LKTHRQRIYDDFASVGHDLVTRHITSPRRLGIGGGSNGGLLIGVEMTQHPEMWNAVVIQVPLLDMLRFEQIAAGASWVAEYGSVKNPEERAFLASISPYNQLSRKSWFRLVRIAGAGQFQSTNWRTLLKLSETGRPVSSRIEFTAKHPRWSSS
jgi:prolyl oligopeptidase PreP (S9A serine peptidase family)